MTGKVSAATVGAAGAGATVTVGMGGDIAKETIPILDLPLAYLEVGNQIAVITVQHSVFLTTALLSSIAVIITITGVFGRWVSKRKAAACN